MLSAGSMLQCQLTYAEDRQLSGQPIDELPRIGITPGHFGGDTNAAPVRYVTAGEGDADGAIMLTAHRDVDADCHTGSRSLPYVMLAMTRYGACEKSGGLLGFARVVYVHWLFSSLSAQCSEEARGGGCCGSGSVGSLGRRWRGWSCTTAVPLSGPPDCVATE
jgi:hypothetical protein